jgi:lysophospholipase L1-like esterase
MGSRKRRRRRGHRKRTLRTRLAPWIGIVGLTGVAYVSWWFFGCPLMQFSPPTNFDHTVEHDEAVVLEAVPGQRDAYCLIPAIPHLVTRDGRMPPYYRTLAFHYSTNSRGFRGAAEVEADHEEGIYRIAVLGTGVTFGNGVDDDEVYTVLLQRELDPHRTVNGERFEVANLAVPGSTTEQGVEHLESILGEIEFDLVVFCFGVNDGLPMFGQPAYRYRNALRHLMELEQRHDLDILYAVEPRSTFYPWPFAAHELAYTQVIREHPGHDVLDLPPILWEVERNHGLMLERDGDLQRVVRYWMGWRQVLHEEQYVPLADEQSISPNVYDYLDTHRVDQATLIDGVHLSVEGHRVVADAMYRHLVDRGLAR